MCPVPLPGQHRHHTPLGGAGLGSVGFPVSGSVRGNLGLVGLGQIGRIRAQNRRGKGSLQGGSFRPHHHHLGLAVYRAGDQNQVPLLKGLRLVPGEELVTVRPLCLIKRKPMGQRPAFPEDGHLSRHGGDPKVLPGVGPLGGQAQGGVSGGRRPRTGHQSPRQQHHRQGGCRQQFSPAGGHRVK